jgi:5-methylthioadenosine/S-adenosylhomocysteine deaminase
MKTLIANARILTMDRQDSEHACADILVSGQTIEAIGPDLAGSPAAAGAVHVEARGMLALPGLINAHLHSPASLQRGSLDGLPLELFMLYEVPPLARAPLAGRVAYVRTALGAIEMLKLGITSVLDDAFYVPAPNPGAIDGVMQAYADSGMRATATLDQPNVPETDKYPYLAGILPPALRRRLDDAPRPTSEELLEHYAHLVGRWNGAAGGRLAAGVSCSAPQRVTRDYFAALSDLSRRLDLPFVVHVLETRLQRVLGAEKYGKSLVRLVRDLGFLDARMQVVHGIWIDDDDIDLLAQAGCTVAHNPVCNLRLGSGIMPFRRLRARGVPICLGTDEAIADDSCNLWNAAKTAGLVHTLTDPDYRNWPTAAEILSCVFHGGARAMRRSDAIGRLAPGFQADLALVDLDTLAFTPLNDLRRQLVYCENGSSVRLTMVAGRIVHRDGRLLTLDEDAIKREARELAAQLAAEAGVADAAAAELMPYYREMYLRAMNADIGMERRAPPRG